MTEESLAAPRGDRRSAAAVLGRHRQLPQPPAGGPGRRGRPPCRRDAATCPIGSPSPPCSGGPTTPQATRLLLAGDPDGAEPLAIEALELGSRAGEPEALVYFKSQMICLHWQRGTLADLAARIQGTSPRPPNAMASIALIFAEGGRQHDAARCSTRWPTSVSSDLAHDPAFITCVAFFADAAIRSATLRSAEALYARIAPVADQVGFDGVVTVGAPAPPRRSGPLLGRHDEAVELLQRSTTIHEAIGAPFFEARSRWSWPVPSTPAAPTATRRRLSSKRAPPSIGPACTATATSTSRLRPCSRRSAASDHAEVPGPGSGGHPGRRLGCRPRSGGDRGRRCRQRRERKDPGSAVSAYAAASACPCSVSTTGAGSRASAMTSDTSLTRWMVMASRTASAGRRGPGRCGPGG